MSEEKCKFIKVCVNFKECENLLTGDCHINELSIRCKNDNKCKYLIIYKQLQTAKEENEKLKRMLEFKQKDFDRAMSDFSESNAEIGNLEDVIKDKNIEIDNLIQQNKQMREALEKVKKDACCSNGDCEHCEYDEDCFGYDAQQALKEVNNEK